MRFVTQGILKKFSPFSGDRQSFFPNGFPSGTITLELTIRRDLMLCLTRTTKTIFVTLSLLALPLSLASAQFDGPYIQKQQCDSRKPIEKNVEIVSNADGDTVNVKAKSGVYAVRMIGMDTPETHYFGHSQGQWGEVASERLAELLPPGTKVKLEFAPGICDSYGRILAHIFKGKNHVNKQMVKEGLAVNYCMYPSVSHCEELGELARKAIEKRLGMFIDSNVELPYDFRRRISKRQQSSYVGSLITKEVFRPGNQDRTPVPERIFFSSQKAISDPFYLVD
jgi:micrococcal nuclease